jgi:hypothetical protein
MFNQRGYTREELNQDGVKIIVDEFNVKKKKCGQNNTAQKRL